MDFRLDDEQLALRDAVRGLCARHFGLGTIASREGEAASAAAWSDLAAMGIFGLAADSVVAAVVALEELAAHLAAGPLVWTVAGAPLVPGAAEGGDRVGGAPFPGPGPVVVPHAVECDTLLVLHPDRVERCPVASLVVEAGEPFDPTTPTAVVTSTPAGEVVGGAGDATALRRRVTVLAAASLVGVAQGALDVAREYALERQQFGVPIGSFQAVKHLLADMYVRVELARAATYAAAAIADDPRAGDPERAASTAKLLAGEAGIANGRTAVQVLGGMGFTWEMLPHRYLKRAWVLAEELGGGREHALALGDALAAELAGR